MKTVLILGGYGHLGQRIVKALVAREGLRLVIAGRDRTRAKRLISQLQPTSRATLACANIDIAGHSLVEKLFSYQPDIVIHTSGPFQNQPLRVAQACIDIGAHYIDLADDGDFVNDMTKLDKMACQQQLLLISGASLVPGLSAAVVDHYRHRFSRIDAIDIAIAPGNKSQRGEAMVRGILSYAGHGFKRFEGGRTQQVFGWMEPRQHQFGLGLGKRWLVNVDVPDLTLFPERYQVKELVRFGAGLELPVLHWSLVAMAYLVKIGLIENWARWTKELIKLSRLFHWFGTDKDAMEVIIKGVDAQGQPDMLRWMLLAPNGVGSNIATLSTLITVDKLLSGQLEQTGARPCVDLFTLEDFYPYFAELGVEYQELGLNAIP